MSQDKSVKKYAPLVGAAGIGSMLGSGIIIGLSATITVWQAGLGLTEGQVGILSGALVTEIVMIIISMKNIQNSAWDPVHEYELVQNPGHLREPG